jgi:large subunit ribosomal protein L5e
MDGDRVMCAATSSELKAHGLTAGLTNYSACYCTGLLIARRLLKQVKLDGDYKGTSKVDGELYLAEPEGEKRPFKALLDVGINRTTTGARVFGCLKGASDGGLYVPHTVKRFPGYTKAKVEVVTNKRGKATDNEKTAAQYDAKVHRNRIFGGHVTEYMNQVKKEDPAKYKTLFSQWDKCLTAAKAKTCEDVYKKVHKAIIADPSRKKAEKKKSVRKVVVEGKAKVFQDSKGRKWLRHSRLSKEERAANVQAKFAEAMAKSK